MEDKHNISLSGWDTQVNKIHEFPGVTWFHLRQQTK